MYIGGFKEATAIKILGLIGPPGSGKTTLASILAAYGSVFRLRKAVHKTDLTDAHGAAKSWLDAATVRRAFTNFMQHELRSGTKLVVCENFPGNSQQVRLLSRMTRLPQVQSVMIVQLGIDEPQIIARLAQRRVCNTCEQDPLSDPRAPAAAASHNPATCARCGSTLQQRPNDQKELLRYRIDRYHLTLPAIRQQCVRSGIVMHYLHANQEPAAIADAITALLGTQAEDT